MVKMVTDRVFNKPRRFGRGQPVFGLALELRVADKHRKHQFGFVENVFSRNMCSLFLANQFAKRAQTLSQRCADTGFVRAAVRRRNSVTIPAVRTVGI